jgi:hypothetical protein
VSVEYTKADSDDKPLERVDDDMGEQAGQQ